MHTLLNPNCPVLFEIRIQPYNNLASTLPFRKKGLTLPPLKQKDARLYYISSTPTNLEGSCSRIPREEKVAQLNNEISSFFQTMCDVGKYFCGCPKPVS